jgi:hypothetical protein
MHQLCSRCSSGGAAFLCKRVTRQLQQSALDLSDVEKQLMGEASALSRARGLSRLTCCATLRCSGLSLTSVCVKRASTMLREESELSSHRSGQTPATHPTTLSLQLRT